jgi:hypothetical protein
MATVTGVLGLCGSGKTRLAQQMTEAVIIDESLPARMGEVAAALQAGRDVVVTERLLCQEDGRRKFADWLGSQFPDVSIKWICVERDLEKANQNCRRPERKFEKPDYDAEAHVRLNLQIYATYTYPEGATVLPMWPHDLDAAP